MEKAPLVYLVAHNHAALRVPIHGLRHSLWHHVETQGHDLGLHPCGVVEPATFAIQSQGKHDPQQPREIIGHIVQVEAFHRFDV
jgi:hypothetical protein